MMTEVDLEGQNEEDRVAWLFGKDDRQQDTQDYSFSWLSEPQPKRVVERCSAARSDHYWH